MKGLDKHLTQTPEEFYGDKLTYQEFYDKVNDWYNVTRPMSGKPRMHVISSWYDMYLEGKDFKFL